VRCNEDSVRRLHSAVRMTTSTIPEMHPHLTGELERPRRARARVKSSSGSPPHPAGMLWLGGWLFTVGFAKLVWWKAILGLVIWPYFLGITVR
jgi:hypothetical protein